MCSKFEKNLFFKKFITLIALRTFNVNLVPIKLFSISITYRTNNTERAVAAGTDILPAPADTANTGFCLEYTKCDRRQAETRRNNFDVFIKLAEQHLLILMLMVVIDIRTYAYVIFHRVFVLRASAVHISIFTYLLHFQQRYAHTD